MSIEANVESNVVIKRLYVGNLDINVTLEDLTEFFGLNDMPSIQRTSKIKIGRNQEPDGDSKYAYVDAIEYVLAELLTLDGHLYNNRVLVVKPVDQWPDEDEVTTAGGILSNNEEAHKVFHCDDFQTTMQRHKEYLEHVGLLDEDEDMFTQRMQELAIDRAERESERGMDLTPYERAYLSKEEQSRIPKLDHTNNLCYKYLRSIGSDWQYNPEDWEDRYKSRLYRRFDTFDKDSDGVMSIDEVLSWADRMKTLCESNDEEIETVRKALYDYFTNYGLTEEGLHRENWCEAHITMGEASKERMKRGEPIHMEMLANAYFDVLDENDDGFVDLPELKKMMNIFRVPEEAAFPFFEMADADKSGTLDKKEMHNLFWRFWFGEYDSSLDHIFAYKY